MTATPTSRPRGRLLMATGLALAPLGMALFAGQLWSRRLAVPWYLPALTLIGASLVAASMRERRTIWRGLALAALLLLGGFEAMALNALRLPPYAGPIAVGRPFPAFEAKRADGTPFTQGDLVGEQNTAMVFFRGRW